MVSVGDQSLGRLASKSLFKISVAIFLINPYSIHFELPLLFIFQIELWYLGCHHSTTVESLLLLVLGSAGETSFLCYSSAVWQYLSYDVWAPGIQQRPWWKENQVMFQCHILHSPFTSGITFLFPWGMLILWQTLYLKTGSFMYILKLWAN